MFCLAIRLSLNHLNMMVHFHTISTSVNVTIARTKIVDRADKLENYLTFFELSTLMNNGNQRLHFRNMSINLLPEFLQLRQLDGLNLSPLMFV